MVEMVTAQCPVVKSQTLSIQPLQRDLPSLLLVVAAVRSWKQPCSAMNAVCCPMPPWDTASSGRERVLVCPVIILVSGMMECWGPNDI